MPRKMKIDFVSDVVCPWCVIGLGGLDRALDNLRGDIEADVEFHPFELNPHMPPGGENTLEHIRKKYNMSDADVQANRERIKARAADVGFTMNSSDASRIYNTFDAHRLLAWSRTQRKQHELKRQLFTLNFTEQKDVGDHPNLIAAAQRAGLDPTQAREVLESDRYAKEVREAEQFWGSRGISGVPAVIVDGRYLISGGQPAAEYERQLRQIASQQAA